MKDSWFRCIEMRINFNQMRLPIILKIQVDMILNEFEEFRPNAFENYFHERLLDGYTHQSIDEL